MPQAPAAPSGVQGGLWCQKECNLTPHGVIIVCRSGCAALLTASLRDAAYKTAPLSGTSV